MISPLTSAFPVTSTRWTQALIFVTTTTRRFTSEPLLPFKSRCVHVRACMYMHVRACMYMHVRACMYMHVRACMYMHVCIYVSVCRCVRVWWKLCVHVCTYACISDLLVAMPMKCFCPPPPPPPFPLQAVVRDCPNTVLDFALKRVVPTAILPSFSLASQDGHNLTLNVGAISPSRVEPNSLGFLEVRGNPTPWGSWR